MKRIYALLPVVCLVISTVRRRWYSGYLADLETLFDCLLQREEKA